MSTLTLTPAQLTLAGTRSLDHITKEEPADQVAIERPWLKKLRAKKRPFGGAKQFVIEKVRWQYDSNGQWYFGRDTVNHNTRDTNMPANFPWGNYFDGFELDEDELFENGITLTKDNAQPVRNNTRDMQVIVDIFRENMTALRLGYEEGYDRHMHLDGTQDPKAIAGMTAMVPFDPTVGVNAGIDAAPNAWWRSHIFPGLTQANVVDTMEAGLWDCQRNGGTPDYILAGDEYVTMFRNAAASQISRYTILAVEGQDAQMDPAIHQAGIATGLHFNRIPILRDPVFREVDANNAPPAGQEMQKSLFMFNCKWFNWRPGQGHDMVTRHPAREHNNFIYRWGLTTKAAFTYRRRNCHARFQAA